MDNINFKLISPEYAAFQTTTDHRTNASPGGLPYLESTETGHAESLAEMKAIPTKANGVYLGFAFEFNYHLLAERPVQKAYICDINPRMLTLYQDIERLVVQHEDRSAFIKAFKTELSTYSEYYFGLSKPIEKILTHITTLEHSWLASDWKYETIRELYLNNKIVHLSLDVAKDHTKFEEIAQELQRNQWVLDCVYLSNIPEWLYNTKSLDALSSNLRLIMSDDTVLIDAKKELWEKGKPKMRITCNPTAQLPDFNPSSNKQRKTNVFSGSSHAPRCKPSFALSLRFPPEPKNSSSKQELFPSSALDTDF